MPRTTVDRSWVEARMDTLYPAHIAAFTRLMIKLRQLLDDDLDQLLILATLSCGASGGRWREGLLEQPVERPSRSTNITSISEVTGIPRETVRRKLKALQDQNLVIRETEGTWKVDPQASVVLREGTMETISYLTDVLSAALAAPTDS